MADDDAPRPDPDAPEGPGPDAPEGPGPGRDPGYFPGEKGRVVPRSAWWALAVACVLLVAFFIVRPMWFTDTADESDLHVPADRHFTKTLAGLGNPDGLFLNDDTPSRTLDFALPADNDRSKTQLHLLGTTQVAQESTVFLMVRLDGTQVFNEQLPRGSNALDHVITVPESLAADGHVRVQIVLHGSLQSERCLPDRATGMVLHLTPDTVMEAALDRPVHTVRDVVAGWDHDLTIVLADQGDEWRSTAAAVGLALTHQGHSVSYAAKPPDGTTSNTLVVGPPDAARSAGWKALDSGGPADATVAVGKIRGTTALAVVAPQPDLATQQITSVVRTTADAAAASPRAITLEPNSGDEVGLAALGADVDMTQIVERRSWSIDYALADLPGGRLPRAARVQFSMPASPADLTWLLNVSLNGTLLQSIPLPRDPGPVEIALPAELQKTDNTLTLAMQRDRDLGGCDIRMTSYPVQLRSESALLLGDDPGAGLTAVPRTLAPGAAVYLPDAAPESVDEQLTAAIPVLAAFVGAQQTPQFVWGAAPPGGAPFVTIGQTPDVATQVRVQDGRLVSGPAPEPLDISAFQTGAVTQCATGPGGTPGLSITTAGHAGSGKVTPFGTDCVDVATPGGGFTVAADGTVARNAPPRTDGD